MENHVSYHQNCPVCGRSLHIGVTLLGKRVYCQHCGGGFIATDAVRSQDASSARHCIHPQLDAVDALIERAEVALGRSDSPSACQTGRRRG